MREQAQRGKSNRLIEEDSRKTGGVKQRFNTLVITLNFEPIESSEMTQ